MPKVIETHLAEIRLHPAAIVLPCLGVTGIAQKFWRLDLDAEIISIFRIVGFSLTGLGFIILYLAYGSMLRASATINPSEHSNSLVSGGIFAVSRNPIYLGWFLFILGIGIANVSILTILIATSMVVTLHFAVILKEEEYLERRFGKEYISYKSRVRRWL